MCLLNILTKPGGLYFNFVAIKASFLMWSHLHGQSPSTTTMSDRTLLPHPLTQSHGTTIFEDNPETLSNSSLSSESPEPISLPRKQWITKNHSASQANTQPLPHLPQEACQLPVFTPIVPPTSSHNAYNTLPTRISHSDYIEPVDICQPGLLPLIEVSAGVSIVT